MNLFEKEIQINYHETDFQGNIKISSIFQILSDIATRHAEQLGLWKRDEENQYVWVISKMKVEILHPISLYQNVKVKTWPGNRKSVIYTRYFAIESMEGEVLVKGSSLWTIIDMKTRRIASPRVISYDFEFNQEEYIYISDPESIDTENICIDKEVSKTIQYNDIDLNQHANNSRYLEWVTDLFTMEEYKKRNIKEITVSFKKEIYFNQQISIQLSNKKTHFIVIGKDENNIYFEVEGVWEKNE